MRTFKKLIGILIIIFVASPIELSFAQESVTTLGRYLTVPNQPLPAQTDALVQIFQVRFPPSVKTIGDAMHYLLRFSGYRLVESQHLMIEARQLFALPLPQVNRVLGPLTLEEGLLTLAGKPFGLLVDPVHRLIAFRLLPAYVSLYRTQIR